MPRTQVYKEMYTSSMDFIQSCARITRGQDPLPPTVRFEEALFDETRRGRIDVGDFVLPGFHLMMGFDTAAEVYEHIRRIPEPETGGRAAYLDAISQELYDLGLSNWNTTNMTEIMLLGDDRLVARVTALDVGLAVSGCHLQFLDEEANELNTRLHGNGDNDAGFFWRSSNLRLLIKD